MIKTENTDISLINEIYQQEKYLIAYILYVGTDCDGLNIYHFLLTKNVEDVFSEGWGEKPACNVSNNILMINNDMYEHIKELKTDIKLDLAQDNSCFSMQDCRDKIIAIAYENIDEYEEYPDEGRIVIHFGDEIDEIEKSFARRNMYMKYIK